MAAEVHKIASGAARCNNLNEITSYIFSFTKMEDSTSIDDLPNPAFGGGGGAVQLPAAAAQHQQQQPHPQIVLPPAAQHAPPQSQQSQVVDPKYMNYIITGIQQTGGSTLGTLPSRDIPMNTLEIQQDEFIRANYVPPPTEKRVDFVEEYERRHRPEKTAPKKAAVATATPLFEDFYFPILAAILFFIFQMPAGCV